MKKEIYQTITLGIFVFFGTGLLITAIFMLGHDQTLFESALYLRADFKNVNGLQRGNNVWLAGVKVGTVSDVEVVSDSVVEVSLRIQKRYNAFIKEDAIAQLTHQGLMGNPLIVLHAGKSSFAVNENQLLASSENSGKNDLGEELKASGENLVMITQDVKRIIKQMETGQGLAGELFMDKGIGSEVKNAVMKLEITADHTALLTGDISSLIKQLEQNKHGVISTLVTDSAFSTVFHQGLANIKITTDNVALLTGNFRELSKHLEQGNNTLGLVLTDTAFAANLKKSSMLLHQDLQAAQHNFLLRGYLRKKKKE